MAHPYIVFLPVLPKRVKLRETRSCKWLHDVTPCWAQPPQR